ncbi:MAG: hypothetical protein ABSC37_16015 [Xanthobacteraceae bacterium]
MPDRKPLLAKLDVGDIFHAEYPNGAKCICLVLSVNDATIDARRVTSQENLEFDRQTGVEKASDGQALAVINSVAPLPAEIHNVFLALDQKYQAVHDQKDIFERNPEYFKLSEAEKKAFRFIDPHYASNPLPPPEP